MHGVSDLVGFFGDYYVHMVGILMDFVLSMEGMT